MAAEGLRLGFTRALPAPRARVFDCFAEAALVARWWGPRGFAVPRIDFVPAPGAGYRIEMQPPEGAAFALTGVFRVVDAPSTLAFTFNWDPADPNDQETLCELSFEERDDSTVLRVEQGPFKTGSRLELHRAGWTESLDRLAALVVVRR